MGKPLQVQQVAAGAEAVVGRASRFHRARQHPDLVVLQAGQGVQAAVQGRRDGSLRLHRDEGRQRRLPPRPQRPAQHAGAEDPRGAGREAPPPSQADRGAARRVAARHQGRNRVAAGGLRHPAAPVAGRRGSRRGLRRAERDDPPDLGVRAAPGRDAPGDPGGRARPQGAGWRRGWQLRVPGDGSERSRRSRLRVLAAGGSRRVESGPRALERRRSGRDHDRGRQERAGALGRTVHLADLLGR